MGIDLNKIYSHSNNKTLEVHTSGVLGKSIVRANDSFLKELIRISVFFHDVGKLNSNFQKKLKKQTMQGSYTKHSLLSAYAFLSFVFQNPNYLKEDLRGDLSWLFSILEIIKKHHGNLSDLDVKDGQGEIDLLSGFLEKESIVAYEFIESLGLSCNAFEIKKDKNLLGKLQSFSEKKWQVNPLKYFSYTQFAFAALIEADKRDAGDLYTDIWWKKAAAYSDKMGEALEKKFAEFAKSEKAKERLNELRTKLRLEACANMEDLLEKDKRIFSLTAPTGAGKTFTLLSLAKEIQNKNKDLGIVYCLPFLSITEQVEHICTHEEELNLDIFSANSRSINKRLEYIQKQLEDNPSEILNKDFLAEAYKGQTFDHPFIITTFVQFFETLVSNRNSTLLKLPNFANRIFLIDEIQAIPPTLFIFFAAWLDSFCKEHNSYVVFSSATMPNFEIPQKATKQYAKDMFPTYASPFPLIEAEKYFSEPIFNRYEIFNELDNPIEIEALAEKITVIEESCLIILNTIRDTKLLYKKLKENEVEEHIILLNTHFIPVDKKAKIELAKEALKNKEKVIVISTQLIEAGVDIDFPIVYRDWCPLPSLIQSAGRCNREGKLGKLGKIIFIKLLNEKKEEKEPKAVAYSIYRDLASKRFLEFSEDNLPKYIQEKDLYNIQANFFDGIKENLSIGDFEYHDGGKKKECNMIKCINEAKFGTLGKFKLIPEQFFGEEYTFYVPKNEEDNAYEILVENIHELRDCNGYAAVAIKKIEIQNQFKNMQERIVKVRSHKKDIIPCSSNPEPYYFNIRVLADPTEFYSFEQGIVLDSTITSFI